jgi:murein DD-endopeptidase MepM/ murein hydrolase activator NlpD
MTRSALGVVVLLVVAAAAVAIGMARCEGTPPTIETASPIVIGADARTVTVAVADAGAGLRGLRATLVHAGGETPLPERDFGGSPLPYLGSHSERERVDLSIDAKALGLASGDAKLRLAARDLSWRDFGAGNETIVEVPLSIDYRPPSLTLAPGITYAKRAGSVALVYDVSDDTERDGVEVGGQFYPSIPVTGEGVPAGRRYALFPLAQELESDVKINVIAVDHAGNQSTRTPQINIKDRVYPNETIVLSQRFLDQKIADLAGATGVNDSDKLKAFQEINTRIRRENEQKIRTVISETAQGPLFTEAFEQMPDSQVRSAFAERRSYMLDGQQVSESIHYGYDLASLAGAPIPASNAGRVVFADELGIYGNCVILDHGLGLNTLYGHLSHIDVRAGDSVEKGQTLGQSGQTGLAGGDHLHFAVLLRGVYVDPVEWWDPKWVREHALGPLAAAGSDESRHSP